MKMKWPINTNYVISLTTRETQNKNTASSPLTPVKMATPKKTVTTEVGKDVKRGTPETLQRLSLTKLKIDASHDPDMWMRKCCIHTEDSPTLKTITKLYCLHSSRRNCR